MGVRPPANDDDEPDVIEFGIAALDDTLSDANVDYPTDARSLTNQVGSVEVPYDAAGHTISLERALAETNDQQFQHEQELLNALHPVFEAKRETTGNRLIARLRSLVPF